VREKSLLQYRDFSVESVINRTATIGEQPNWAPPGVNTAKNGSTTAALNRLDSRRPLERAAKIPKQQQSKVIDA